MYLLTLSTDDLIKANYVWSKLRVLFLIVGMMLGFSGTGTLVVRDPDHLIGSVTSVTKRDQPVLIVVLRYCRTGSGPSTSGLCQRSAALSRLFESLEPREMESEAGTVSTPLLKDSNVVSEISDGERDQGEARSFSVLRQLSGKWQFKFKAFPDTGSTTEGIREYNKRQREALAMFEQVDTLNLLSEAMKDEDKRNAESEALAVNCSNLWNIILLALKVYATVASRSLAIAASTLDSLLDLLAGGILLFTQWSMRRTDVYNYPIGKLRVQPVGIVVFAAVMATLGLQVLIEGFRQLVEGKPESRLDKSQRMWMIAIMGVAIVVKLALYIYCRSFKNEIIQAYAMDHQFDVVTNVVGLAAALLADRFYWWLDPLGAIALAVYTIVNWSKTVFENAVSLIGKSASPEVLQKLTYMAFNHHHDIQHIDTVRAYTFGALYFVEVDIQLPESMPLKDAHDIGQSLQDKFEALPEVERAFVHLDFECTHKPEHQRSLLIVDS